MRGGILKTALISFASALGAIILASVAILLFFPSAAGKLTFGMGSYGASANYALKAYEKNPTDENLKTLVERSILAGKYELTVEYAPKYLDCGSFEAFAKKEDGKSETDKTGSYYCYVTGSYAVAEYRLGNVERALDASALYTGEYVKFNATEYLMEAAIEGQDKVFAKKLLMQMRGYLFPGEQGELLRRDLNVLEEFVGGRK
ncbi:MAG: hypothetical protein J6U35_02870 [Clostridia bacterium]|nr:hypothetical protein [Clostridia bacterium]